MKISKTLFKELIRCESYYSLNKLYEEKRNASFANGSLFDLQKYLDEMIDKNTYENKLENPMKEYEQEQFAETERVSIKYANKILKTNLKAGSLAEQKEVAYRDQEGNTFYTKIDGYQETIDEIIVLEAKATTTNKFIDEKKPFFEKEESILILKERSELETEDEIKAYDKFLIDQVFRPNHALGKYIFDGLYTYWLVTKNNPHLKKISFYLAFLNHEYILDLNRATADDPYPYVEGKGEIVTLLEMGQFYNEYLYLLEAEVKKIQSAIKKNVFIQPEIDSKCKRNDNSEECLFCPVCYAYLENIPGSALYFAGKKKYKDILEGKITMDMYSDSELTSVLHKIQREAFIKDKQHINKEAIKKWLDKLEYPIYYLDFETLSSPLPRFQDETPYMQSVFQFSLHIEHSKDALKDINENHYSFLVPDFGDHREECVKALIKEIDLKNGGTVLVYNDTFEKSRIKEFAEIFPQYEKELLKIHDNIVDLMDAFKRKINNKTQVFFYDNKLQGSYSIKKVLPVFAPELSYKDLEIQEGMMAQEAYYSFPKLDEEDLEEVRKNLEEYCKLDTWSMVLIVHALSKL